MYLLIYEFLIKIYFCNVSFDLWICNWNLIFISGGSASHKTKKWWRPFDPSWAMYHKHMSQSWTHPVLNFNYCYKSKYWCRTLSENGPLNRYLPQENEWKLEKWKKLNKNWSFIFFAQLTWNRLRLCFSQSQHVTKFLKSLSKENNNKINCRNLEFYNFLL